jgi:hypothetical protein
MRYFWHREINPERELKRRIEMSRAPGSKEVRTTITPVNKHDFNVGDGASMCIGSDSRPATVIKVTPTRITVQSDLYRNTNGENFMSGVPTFEYTPNPEGYIETYSVRKNGRILSSGSNCGSLGHGRRYYDDPSF